MLLDYIQAAMNTATYEILEDDGSYYGKIPKCKGVYANADTLESCRSELREVMEEWILVVDIGRELLSRLLIQAGISKEEWEGL